MKIYALTGGIGSGKSTVAKFFIEAGIPVISADALNAEAAKSPEVQKQIFDRFGTNDRMELRRIIFADAQAKKDIESIMHPLVQDLFFRKFNTLYDEGHDLAVYEFALLFELGQKTAFEGVISVVCPEEIRINRVLSRDAMDEQIARNILKCQTNDPYRMLNSDYVIESDCTLEVLEERTKDLIGQIRLAHPSPLSEDKPS